MHRLTLPTKRYFRMLLFTRFNSRSQNRWCQLATLHRKEKKTFSSLIHMTWQGHTVAIWTFTFHKKSGFVKVILKAYFKPTYRPVSWTFWSKNSDLLHSFSFYFLQVLSNPLQLLLFQKDWIAWHFCNLNMSSHWNKGRSR